MKSFIEQAQFYASYHQNLMTRYTHLVGVPLIVFSIMILLGFVQILIPGVFSTNFAVIGTLILLGYYFRLHWQLALVLTPFMFILLWIANIFSHAGPTKLATWIFVITFIVGWAFQLYGHFLEGKRPAFMVNLSQALIAPLYLTAEVLFMGGMMKGLKEQIYGHEE